MAGNNIAPTLNSVFSVHATNDPNVYIAEVEITDTYGERYRCHYTSTPGDPHGHAPIVRSALEAWLSRGDPVSPYVPPTAEELRAALPALSPRQIRLALASIGINEANVDAALADDDAGLIEWKFATQYERTHVLIQSLGSAFDLSEDQIDALWTWATAL